MIFDELAPTESPLGDILITPRLAVTLDLWGQVVAHRAGCCSRTRWIESATKKRPLNRSGENHGGLAISAYELQKDWRGWTRGESSFPRATRPTPWVVRLAAMEPPSTRSAPGPISHVGDLRTVAAAYLTASKLLGSDNRRGYLPAYLEGLVVWLFAVPHYTGEHTSIESWCHRRYGGTSNLIVTDRVTRRFEKWVHWSCRRI